jgi:hypothetical protein
MAYILYAASPPRRFALLHHFVRFNVEDDLMYRSSYAPVIVSAIYAHVFGMWYLQITNLNVPFHPVGFVSTSACLS